MAFLAFTVSAQSPDVVVVHKTHFDIGYTGMASEVIQRYRTTTIDNALNLVDASNSLLPEQRFVWTIPGWPMQKIMDNWPGQTVTRQTRIRNAFQQGRFVVHALPFSFETESMDEEDIVRGLGFSSALSRQFGLPLPKSGKMTDVPSHSWVLPTLLKHAGIDFLHIGCNPASASPNIPQLFFWEGPDGSRLLTWYDQDYGSSPNPPQGWFLPNWLSMSVTGDNAGPPTNAQMTAQLAQYQAAGKKVKVGTLDDYRQVLLANGTSSIPVIRGDMPDTWIHGTASMPIETKMARDLRSSQIPALEVLNTMICLQGISTTDEKQKVAVAYDHSVRYGEHTWGLNDPYEDYGTTWLNNRKNGVYKRMEASWAEKGAEIHAAVDSIEPALAGKLLSLANAAPISGKRISVFNPLPWKREGLVKLKWAGVAPLGLQDLATGEIIPVSVLNGELAFIVKAVPSMGYKTYGISTTASITNLPDTVRSFPAQQILENSFYRVTLNTATGGVSSILDKRNGKELIQSASSDGAAGRYLHEFFSPTEVKTYTDAYLKSQVSWAYGDFGKTGLPASSYRLEKANGMFIRFEGDAFRQSAVLSTAANTRNGGMELRVTLYSGQPYVDFKWSVNSNVADPWPQSEWLAFPLNVTSPNFRMQRVGGIVNPALDLIKGSNHDLFSLSGGVAVIAADGSGVALCSRDLPLVSLDRMGSWKYSRDFNPQRPNVYFQLFNNQWDTNFQQWFDGSWSADVRLWSFAAYAGDSSLVNPSAETRSPMLATYVDAPAGKAPLSASGPSVGRKGVLITAFGANPDGAGTILRLWELAGIGGNCPITLPVQMGVTRAQPLNLRGEAMGGTIPVVNGNFSVDLPHNTPLSLRLDYERCVTPLSLGATKFNPRPELARQLIQGTRFHIPQNWVDLKALLIVHDLTGRQQGRFIAKSTSIDLQSSLGLGEGLYFVRIVAP